MCSVKYHIESYIEITLTMILLFFYNLLVIKSKNFML